MEKTVKKGYMEFLGEVKERIRKAQYYALRAVNNELIALYLDLGRMIFEKQSALKWGKSVVESLANDLQLEYPGMKGFSSRNIWRMKAFYEMCQTNPKLPPMVAEISWAKNIAIMESCRDIKERMFYIQMTKKWTGSDLAYSVDSLGIT